MRILLTTSTSVTVTFDIDPDPETWGSRQSDQCDIFKMITCSAGQWPASVSLNSTMLPPSAHLDAYAFTSFWLERLASVIEEMPPIYFKQHFLPLLPDHLLQDHDPVIQLALRLYRQQSTIRAPRLHGVIILNLGSAPPTTPTLRTGHPSQLQCHRHTT
jgi:hypothetical protein